MDKTENSTKCSIIVRNGCREATIIDLPYDEETLMKVLNQSIEQCCGRIKPLATAFRKEQYTEHVFIRKGYEHRKVAVREIAYLEAQRNYCNIHLSDGKYMSVSIPMVEVYEYLSPNTFKRIHRSFVVNLEHVDAYIGNMVRLKNGKEIVIGREYRESIRNEFVCIGSRKRVREKKE